MLSGFTGILFVVAIVAVVVYIGLKLFKSGE